MLLYPVKIYYLYWFNKTLIGLIINLTTLNLIEEKVGSSLQHMGTGDLFLCRTPVAQTIRTTINKWDLLKLRSFCKAKDTVNKTKRQPTEWKKIFTNPTSDKGLNSKVYKELKKVDIKIPNSFIKKWSTDLNRILNKRILNGWSTLKNCSTSLAIREMQIKMTLIYHLTPVRG